MQHSSPALSYTIVYRKSKSNANADSVSQLPLQLIVVTELTGDANDLLYQHITDVVGVKAKAITKRSRADGILSQVMIHISRDQRPNNIEIDLNPYQNTLHEKTIISPLGPQDQFTPKLQKINSGDYTKAILASLK
ncbi:hypothetical protein PoB_003345600 [Plakobranchus ocellatus]|uniref:Uncharacterized protein n=1 Tax=Plakobranchus ocellatus TaxID=259542 RepID=A0AAV4AF80_9GAST|nr:hypothetical protein PoB_003345600 [Plakobranchus ocellatus]